MTPKLKADWGSGEGSVKCPEEWGELDALLRADLLKDWIYDLTEMYDEAVKNIFPAKTHNT
jgi:hypothetical protein